MRLAIVTATPPAHTESDLKRFWSKVDKDGPTPGHRPDLGPCWEWLGYRFHTGYGLFWLQGRTVSAHRFSLELELGELPSRIYACHHCDNRGCVRPSHMFPGTCSDNMRDAIEKGRIARGDRNGKRTHPESIPRGKLHHAYTKPERMPRGEKHGMSKLTMDGVREMRALHLAGMTSTEIAARYNVALSTAARIVKRKTWRHVA